MCEYTGHNLLFTIFSLVLFVAALVVAVVLLARSRTESKGDRS